MTGIRKWLGRNIEIRFTWGELLAIVLLVTLVNIFWPGVPTWAFFLLGATINIADRAGRASGCALVRWLRRRSAA